MATATIWWRQRDLSRRDLLLTRFVSGHDLNLGSGGGEGLALAGDDGRDLNEGGRIGGDDDVGDDVDGKQVATTNERLRWRWHL